jgi:hypothetical protein
VLLLEVTSGAAAWNATEQISGTRAGMPFVGIVSADLGPELAEILAALRPGLREIVCFDSLAEPVVEGQDLAMRTLEELGSGQDFVFTVPVLEAAVDHAVDTLQAPEHGGWEGRFVVVVGTAPVIDRARAHLSAPAA